jgi:hypothetical protein
VALVLVCAVRAQADSVLNFVAVGSSEILVTNTSNFPADVRFTLYGPDGQPAAGALLNNASYRVPAMGQFSMSTVDIFRSKGTPLPAGWIQAVSSTNGLLGTQLNGDLLAKFDSLAAANARTYQVIPHVSQEPTVVSRLILTNPNSQATTVFVTFFDGAGTPVLEVNLELASREQRTLLTSGASARVMASGGGVVAVGAQESGQTLVLIEGQTPDVNQPFARAIPFFKNGNGTSSLLALTNPAPTAADALVSFVTRQGLRLYITPVQVPGNGSTVLGWSNLAGLFGPANEGWLLVEAIAPLTGVALVDSKTSITALPLQIAPSDRMLFSRPVTVSNARVVLIGDAERQASVTLTLNRSDGTTAAQRDIAVRAYEQVVVSVEDLLPGAASLNAGFITLRSSVPLHGVELVEAVDGSAQAAIGGQRLMAGYAPAPVTVAPRIAPAFEGVLGPGVRLNIIAEGIASDAVLVVNGQVVAVVPTLFGTGLIAELPANLDPGPVTVMIRSSNGDSNAVTLGVYSPDGSLTRPIKGQALFQKVEVTDAGLDLSRTSVVPIRNALVEVVDRITQAVVSVSQTDGLGQFVAAAPDGRGITVRVVSRVRFQDLRVLNNTDGNKPYVVSRDLDEPEDVELIETSRNAGAFNILDAIQLSNALVSAADARLIPPPVTVYWSERNINRAGKISDGLIGTTFFNLATNTGYVLGDRGTDSDEFDDAVIIHEYAHMLAARFSRDDSPGGAHLMGDVLDPRVAWSEGFANFFSSAARGTSIYRDSKGPTGALGVKYDLEENVPIGDRPGYSSEASVQGLLWDLFDDVADEGDSVRFPISAIWSAFIDLRFDRFVYLPYFLEHFLDRNVAFTEGLRSMVVLRNIDFQPGVRPSVTNPFPRSLLLGESRVGEVDSFSTKRMNLAGSSHFFVFTLDSAGPVSLRLDIESFGPANNPNANDLDLFLFDANGKKVEQSDSGLNGQSERIQMLLGSGTYFAEIRSYYTRAETNTLVFNSGRYRLSLSR